MIKRLLEHSVRKDLRRANKKITHRQYLKALHPINKVTYWAEYHKKKLIFLIVLGIISWTYGWQKSAYRYILKLASPVQFLHQMFIAEEKIPTTILEQTGSWEFDQDSKHFLEKLYYEADKRLIFGVSRNYLFQVYKALGLLQKPEEERNFWISGGFYRKRNQLISGVGLNQFLSLFQESYRELCKTNSELTHQAYLKDFSGLFVQKGGEIFEWEKQFNKKRHNQFLKTLQTDNQIKQDQISTLMRQNLDIKQEQVQQKLQQMGMKGMSVRQRWLYWRNREILLSLREEALQRRLSLGFSENQQQREMKKRLQTIQKNLQQVQAKKKQLKQLHVEMYEEELI